MRMDDSMLCLGSPLCRPHTWHHCGADLNNVTHGLSCRYSESDHHVINNIVDRALTSHISSRLESSYIYDSDKKHPDWHHIISVEEWQVVSVWCKLFWYIWPATTKAGVIATIA